MSRAGYATFAEFYDAAMGDRSDIIGDLRELIAQYSPAAESVLELAVGTGTVLAGLSSKYKVTGLDASPEMLRLARPKLPSVDLIQADMSAFELGKQLDVIYCVFDSINHLPTLNQWENMFQHTAEHLKPRGLFIFDMNTLGRLKRLEQIAEIQEEFGNRSLQVNIKRKNLSALTFDYNFYEYQNSQKINLGQERIIETSFPIDQVRAAAERYFEALEIFDQSGNLPSDELDRTFFVYRKN